MNYKILFILLSTTSLLSGCLSPQVKVDKWEFTACQPHAFYIAFKGESLKDVASLCRIEEARLMQYNAWLTTRQPFTENTLVWLKNDTSTPSNLSDLQIESIDASSSKEKLGVEGLTPLGLPPRKVKSAK